MEGIANTDGKIAILKSKFGFDEEISYTPVENRKEAIAVTCSEDVYFDNVGGNISDQLYLLT